LERAGTKIVENQSNQTGNDAYNVVDGLMVKVKGPEAGINLSIPGPYGEYAGHMGWNLLSGTRWVSWADHGGITFGYAMFNGPAFFGSSITAADYKDIEIKWAGDTKEAEPDRWSKGYRYLRPGYAFADMGDVPLAAYDVSDPANPRRINVCFVESAGMTSTNDPNTVIPPNGIWDMGWHELPSDTGYCSNGGREYLFFMTSDYDPTGGNTLYTSKSVNANGDEFDVMYAIWPNERPGHPFLEADWDMAVYASKVNAPSDQFTFAAPKAATVEAKYVKEDMAKIRVVPNPYYGYHNGEMNLFDRWVQFTNLPQKCTIRIFDLAGSLVKVIEKNDQASLLKWNMKNEYDLPVASGIYVYHVQAPSIGETVGKMAIFTPNERLDTY